MRTNTHADVARRGGAAAQALIHTTCNHALLCQDDWLTTRLCAEFLRRVAEAEQQQGIPFDRDVDAFLRACTVEGKTGHPLTQFYLRILGLEVSLCWSQSSSKPLQTLMSPRQDQHLQCMLPDSALSSDSAAAAAKQLCTSICKCKHVVRLALEAAQIYAWVSCLR